MMLAPRCFSRVTLVLLSVILGLLLFTTLRVHNGIPPTVSITAAQSMVENLAGEWFHLDRQHPDKVSPFTPQVDNGAEEQKPPELLVEGKASRHLARPPELEYLRQEKFGLTDTIVYTQHCIKPVYDKTINRTLITNITSPFISDRSTISLTLSSDPPVSLPDCAPLLLPVPPPYRKTPHPELIFGVASTYSRLSSPATLSAFAHWLSHSKSRLILTITDYHSLPPSSTLSSLSKLYSSHSILATCLPPPVQSKSYTTSQLHFLLLPTLLSFSTPQTTFLSLVDDDTFFPALHPLSAALSRFNPSLPLYLGAKSDSQSANGQYGEMAFGGAGVFISVPLAKMLVPYYELCAAGGGGDYRALGGDGILRDCVYNFTETRLTEVRGLWQGDVRGDASGIFEGPRNYNNNNNNNNNNINRGHTKRGLLARRDRMDRRGGAAGEKGGAGNVKGKRTTEQPSSAPPLLSLHHWRSWFHAPVDKMAGVNEVCGDCFLQRWRTGVGENETGSSDSEKRKGLWVNGYSYTEYSPGSFPTEEDLQKVEGTWLYAEEGDYEDAYGPLRQRLGEGEKKQWLLVDAYWTRDGKGWRGQKKQFRQLYVYHAPRVLTGEEKENKEAVDEVLEVVWDI